MAGNVVLCGDYLLVLKCLHFTSDIASRAFDDTDIDY